MTEDNKGPKPFKPEKVKVMQTCFVDKRVLDEHGTCVFQGQFYDKDKTRCTYTIMPDSFEKVQKNKEYMDVFKWVGLDGYFSLPPCGIDLQRIYELISSINKDDNAKITDLDGELIDVKIDEEVINEALKFKTTGALKLPHRLSKTDRKQIFVEPSGTHETFRDLYRKEVVVPLMLYNQHFHIGKPPKYTLPNKRVACFMTTALQKKRHQPAVYSKGILNELVEQPQSVTFKRQPYIGAGHMLTRITYQALGAMDKMPAPISQWRVEPTAETRVLEPNPIIRPRTKVSPG